MPPDLAPASPPQIAPPARLADGGPTYRETPADPFAPGSPVPAEPFNTATAAVFVALAVYWAWAVRGRWRRFPFLSAAIPVLLTGGVGGTLYHAHRTRRLYFLLDVIPIQLLGLGVAVWLCARLARTGGRGRVFGYAAAVVAAFVAANTLLRRSAHLFPGNLLVNVHYAALAGLILTPVAVVLVRTRFRHGTWVLVGVLAFAVAWFCRLIDERGLSDLPMGTHWLWHLFGAAATQAIAVYVYRLEGEGGGVTPPGGVIESSRRA